MLFNMFYVYKQATHSTKGATLLAPQPPQGNSTLCFCDVVLLTLIP